MCRLWRRCLLSTTRSFLPREFPLRNSSAMSNLSNSANWEANSCCSKIRIKGSWPSSTGEENSTAWLRSPKRKHFWFPKDKSSWNSWSSKNKGTMSYITKTSIFPISQPKWLFFSIWCARTRPESIIHWSEYRKEFTNSLASTSTAPKASKTSTWAALFAKTSDWHYRTTRLTFWTTMPIWMLWSSMGPSTATNNWSKTKRIFSSIWRKRKERSPARIPKECWRRDAEDA